MKREKPWALLGQPKRLGTRSSSPSNTTTASPITATTTLPPRPPHHAKMTATSAKPARPDLQALKHALAAHQTCSDAAVKALQELLGANAKQDKSNQDTKTTTRPRSKTATKISLDIHTVSQPALAPREKFLLATEVVNSSLKALSDALKSQPSSQSREPTKSSGLTKSSSLSAAKAGPPPSVVAVAECSRLAFAYLRSSEAWKTSGKTMPALQLETGMLSLVGKLLSHGLEGLAAKELRVLKKRLETYLRPAQEEMETGKQGGEQGEKETLASLLAFGEINEDSPALQLALNHQLYVLKIIGSSKRPSTIESASEFLQTSSPSSPINILQYLAAKPGNKDKAARQLETVAQMLLSLCPSISSSEDATACDSSASPSPDTVFQLQSLAIEARSKWWKLSGHQGDSQKELLDPFSKCLAAFSRRSGSLPSEKYSLAVEKLEALESSVVAKSRDRNVCSIMSSLAQSADLSDEAMQWIKDQASSTGHPTSDAARAGSLIRIATLSLDSKPSGEQTLDLDANIDSALKSLEGSLKGDSADLDSLLNEVSGLRRSATKAFVDASKNPDFRQKCFSIVSACTHFLARYIGTAPAAGADDQVFFRHGERLQVAAKSLKGFIDSAMSCCKALVSSESITWDALDHILEDCHFILHEIEAVSKDDSKKLEQISTNLGRPFVRISALYWLFFAYLRKKKPSDEGLLQSLRKSAMLLLDRPEEEKVSGLVLLKLEKLGEVLEEKRRYEEAEKAYSDSIQTQISVGTLRETAEKVSGGSLQQVMLEGRPATFLKTATSLHLLLVRQSQKNEEKLLFLDMKELEAAERSVLLEVQLILCCETRAKSRKPTAALCNTIQHLVQLLFSLYDMSEHPLRRQRAATHVLRLGVECQDILGQELFSEATACKTQPGDPLGSDAGLHQYQEHYAASHAMSIALLESPPSTNQIEVPLRTWQSILDNTDTWSQLTTRVDAFEVWMSQLQMVSDFLGMKALDFMQVPALSIMSKAMELQQPPDHGNLVQAMSSLGAQYARLGYSGKAGTVLAKAQGILGAGDVPTEAVLQWHLAYAEYMLVLGNLEKW